MMKKILTIAALALTIVACSNDDTDIQTPTEQPAKAEGIPFTATISMGESATTRALSENGSKIETSWADGEKVALIYKVGGTSYNTEATVTKQTDNTATISATLQDGATNGSEVTIIYPSTAADGTTGNVKSDLLYTQNGLLTGTNSISEKYDVRKGAGNLSISGGTATVNNGTPGTTVALANQFAIFKFTTKNYDASATINVSPLTITIGTQDYVITPASATSELYVALPAVSSQTVSFSGTVSRTVPGTISGTVGSMPYLCSKSGVSFDAGQYYQSTLKMLPQGAIPGKFTVNNSGKKVYFSQGNLQATTTDRGFNLTWAFATNQWDYIGNRYSNIAINHNGGIDANGTVDLFGWVGNSSNWVGNTKPYGIINSNAKNQKDGYGNVAGESLKSDWGTLAITNGGNTKKNGWRTLTYYEWLYLFNTRNGSTVTKNNETISNARYTHAKINTDVSLGVCGLIIFPDGVTFANNEATTWGTINGNSSWGTRCTTAQWTALAAKGCVFLPAAGYRFSSNVSEVGNNGYYWSSSSTNDAESAISVYFSSNKLNPGSPRYRYYGNSVRLVRDAE